MTAVTALKKVADLTALDDCVELRSGKTPSRNRSDFWVGTIPWFSAKDLKSFDLENSKEHVSEAAISDGAPMASVGDLLMLVRGMTLMKNVPVGVLRCNASFNQDLKCLRPLNGLSSGYLGYILAASRSRLMAMVDQAGHGTGRLPVERLLSLPIWKPSLVAQHYIEELLHRHDRILKLSQDLITAKRLFKHGLTQQLLTGQKRFPEFQGYNWKTVALGDLVTYTPRKIAKPPGKFLSAGVRSHGKGVFLKEQFPSEGIALEELFELKRGDLVVNITFGWEGAVAIVPPAADGALVSHRFPTYEIDQTKVLAEYLGHIVRTKRFVFDVGVASPGGAGRNRVLNRREFLEINIRLPSTNEQERIAQTLSHCARELYLWDQLRVQIEQEKSVLLSRLLSGELPVPATT